MVSIDEAREMLDELIEALPPEVFSHLNGGVILLPDVKVSPEARAEDLFTLGEYENSRSMGRMVRIYYGSIFRAKGDLPPAQFLEALREVLYHELTHHLESMAGENGLELDDALHLQWYKMQR